MTPSNNKRSLFKRLLRACIVAVVTAVLLFFVSVIGIFMMLAPVVYFISLTIKLLGISDQGGLFYVIFFWSVLAFFISFVFQSEQNEPT
jgi:hypothetical protein